MILFKPLIKCGRKLRSFVRRYVKLYQTGNKRCVFILKFTKEIPDRALTEFDIVLILI